MGAPNDGTAHHHAAMQHATFDTISGRYGRIRAPEHRQLRADRVLSIRVKLGEVGRP
jgi:hypothetical protein